MRGHSTYKYGCRRKTDLEIRGMMIAQGDGFSMAMDLRLPLVSSSLKIMIICGVFHLKLVGSGNFECINSIIFLI